ncbi:MAG: carbon-nitrogen hydrolase family protein [Planctomycetota bacterium]|jgi:N-carbamoylputrescine amidase
MRIAVISNRNQPGYPQRNLPDHLRWIRKAAGAGARLVLFPELSLSGYSTGDFQKAKAMALRDRTIRELVAAAGDHDLYVAFGVALRQRRRLYISHVLAGPGGIVGHYEKVHLAGGPKGEARIFSPGEAFGVFDVDGVGVGINICFDGRFAASSLCLAHLGAEIILHPHGNTVGSLGRQPREWTAKKRAYIGPRAVDTCTYMAVCNSVGDVVTPDGSTVRYGGGALVLGPKGTFLARSPSAARRPHMILADLDIDKLRKQRSHGFHLDYRPDVYARILAREGNYVRS